MDIIRKLKTLAAAAIMAVTITPMAHSTVFLNDSFDGVIDDARNLEYLKLTDERVIGKSFNEISSLLSGSLSGYRFASAQDLRGTFGDIFSGDDFDLSVIDGDPLSISPAIGQAAPLGFGDFFTLFGETEERGAANRSISIGMYGDPSESQLFGAIVSSLILIDNIDSPESVTLFRTDQAVDVFNGVDFAEPNRGSFLVRDLSLANDPIPAVPLPSSISLFGLGFLGLVAVKRKLGKN
jgi:hypothetical protein